jgi:hypothetical protein
VHGRLEGAFEGWVSAPQAADDGVGYFALGTIFVLGSLRDFAEGDAPGAPCQGNVGRPYFAAVVGVREERAPAGDFGSSHHWQRRPKGFTEWYEIARGGEDAPLLWYLERGRRRSTTAATAAACRWSTAAYSRRFR